MRCIYFPFSVELLFVRKQKMVKREHQTKYEYLHYF